ncbi:MAG: T9SS type A sorting domain-containing protein [Bacteroidetes bacterium]|nr:T9SS type A sorting domain-containing protein [Bacteroidota bacterium]
MSKFIHLLFSLFFVSVLTQAQPAFFTKEFGDTTLIHTGKAAFQSSSGSIYYGGHALNINADSMYAEFSKLDENGNLIFSKLISYGGSHLMVERMMPDRTGNFLLCCNVYTAGNVTPLVLRVDTSGTVVQSFDCGSPNVNNSIVGIAEDIDGCIVVSGFYPDSTTAQFVQFFAQKFSSSGILQWTFLNNDIKKNLSFDCHFLADGRIILSGDEQLTSGTYNPFLVCLDSTNGQKQWELSISSHYNSGSKSVMQDSDGNLVLVGEAATDSSANFDIILSKIDPTAGTLIWHKYLRASNESDAGFHLLENAFHEYLITGYGYDTATSKKRVVLILTDSSGTELSRDYFADSPINIAYTISPSIYDGYLLAGTDNTLGQNILVYARPSGSIGISEVPEHSSIIYPNPASTGTELKLKRSVEHFDVVNISGQVVFSGNDSASIPLQSLSPGAYIIRFSIARKQFSELLIVQ